MTSREAPGAVWVVSAPSGGGKTSLCKALVERLSRRGIVARLSVSCTTRAPRPGEVDGTDYHFVGEARFSAMVAANAFVEHAGVFGRHYGTPRAPLEQALAAGEVLLLDIDWQGGRQIRSQYPDAGGVFVLPPSIAVLRQRLRGRLGSTTELIASRMQAAREEMSHYLEYPFVLVNDNFETALSQFEALVSAERLRRPAQQLRYAALLRELLEANG
ncbi:MAG TPA: guanylate kinase [Nevskiaceae bacterium]|nr:guanylate kinase [Nevskiaceae bacterium]